MRKVESQSIGAKAKRLKAAKTKKLLEKIEENRNYCRALADTYISLQKTRIASFNRIHAILRKSDEEEEIRESVLNEIAKGLVEMEKKISKEAKNVLNDNPIYVEFLSKVKGLGNVLSLKLLSIKWDLDKPLGSWNAYAGLVPHVYKCKCKKGHKILLPFDPSNGNRIARCYFITDTKQNKKTKQTKFIRCGEVITKGEIAPCRKHKGYAIFWNPKVKTLFYLIGVSFAKTGKFYKNVYEKWKNIYLTIKGLKEGHAIKCGLRKAEKLFLANFYQAYHEILGLDYRDPYQFEYLKHDSGKKIKWTEVVEFDES